MAPTVPYTFHDADLATLADVARSVGAVMLDPPADINAVLDRIEAANPVPDVEPEPTPAPTPAPPAAVAPAVDDLSKFGEHEPYVKELRAENAKYRTERNALQERYGVAFEGLDATDQQAFLDIVQLYKTDPAAAGKWMSENGQALATALEEATPPPATDADRPLTKAELDRYMAQRDRSASQEREVAAVNDNVRKLGLEPDSVDGQMVMLIALKETGGDIAKAHGQFTARYAQAGQKAVADLLAGKAAEAANGVAVVPQAGAAGEADKKPSSVREAGRMLEARLAAQQGA